jgi:hypothetical protein
MEHERYPALFKSPGTGSATAGEKKAAPAPADPECA